MPFHNDGGNYGDHGYWTPHENGRGHGFSRRITHNGSRKYVCLCEKVMWIAGNWVEMDTSGYTLEPLLPPRPRPRTVA